MFFTLATLVSIVSALGAVSGTPVVNETGNNTIAVLRSGSGTWFNVGTGACGITNNNNDLIVAVATQVYDTFPGATTNPNTNPICQRSIRASSNGKSVVVVVRDKCSGCGTGDLDFSPTAFEQLAPLSVGRISITWDFL